jgi:signal transduction histidine kinase
VAGCRVTVQTAVADVRADPVRLRQAVDNLLDNAVRYAPGSPVRVAAWQDDGAVVVSVADGGPGWPPGLQDRLFEPFVRGAREPSDGAGLGLAVVRAVAEAHGGSVRTATAPGGGAVVELVLPA